MRKEKPILLVTHDAGDHSWQFIGSTDASMKDAMLVCLEEIVKLDLSTLEVADLPPGWRAVRQSPKHPWIRSESRSDEEETGA